MEGREYAGLDGTHMQAFLDGANEGGRQICMNESSLFFRGMRLVMVTPGRNKIPKFRIKTHQIAECIHFPPEFTNESRKLYISRGPALNTVSKLTESVIPALMLFHFSPLP